MTLSDLLIFLEGQNERMVEDWRIGRKIAYTIAASNRNPKKQFPPMHKWMPLPGDAEAVKEYGADRKKQYEEVKERLKKQGFI